ncbi:conserved protein of unknown function [Pseudomonas sp. JV551A1]|nr:conserved protein of unknown function [Pseudomonas sp. JV551A1]
MTVRPVLASRRPLAKLLLSARFQMIRFAMSRHHISIISASTRESNFAVAEGVGFHDRTFLEG